jgi:hypothetical protein
MPCVIQNLTAQFTDPKIVWSESVKDVERHFGPAVRNITCGLYVMYFRNHSDASVFDKNGSFSRGGAGKLVIYGNEASLKPGKFEGGLVRRRAQDADHLHRSRTEAIGTAFRESLQFLLVLDLSSHGIGAVGIGENLLKKDIDGILEGRLRPGSTRRGDWRHLSQAEPPGQLVQEACNALERVARNLGVDQVS